MEVSLPQQVVKSFDRVKDFSTEVTRNAVDTVSQTADRAINTVGETMEKAKDSITATTANAVNTLVEATHQAVSRVSTTAAQAKDSLTETASITVHNITTATDKAVDNITETTSTAIENSVGAYIDKQLNSIRIWIDSHAILSSITKAFVWGIYHPILSLILIIFSIFVLRRFIIALGQFLEQTFLFVLQAPGKFTKFLLGLFLTPLSKLNFNRNTIKQSEVNVLSLNPAIPATVSENKKERLTYILNRLEAIRDEQNQLLQEVTTILASSENTP
ncbi:hypothetical protein [Aerosakkonema funiforme]|uniref:hypothetical protein n=1 Tax=Aerosakkonema funiforme TaxID=1246630 RepID=UPI0035B72656